MKDKRSQYKELLEMSVKGVVDMLLPDRIEFLAELEPDLLVLIKLFPQRKCSLRVLFSKRM